MPLPDGLVQVTVFNTYTDEGTKPRKGHVLFKLVSPADPGGDMVAPGGVRAVLDVDGAIAITLVTSDAAPFHVYQVEEFFKGGVYYKYNVEIPYDVIDTNHDVDLSLQPHVALTTTTRYVTKAELDDLKSRVSTHHIQYDLATTWTWVHNLGYRPNIHVENTANEQVICRIEHVSDNEVRIHSTYAIAGRAYAS